MPTLKLTEYDKSLLAGSRGEAARTSMRILVEYGRALGATDLISITRAHVDGCLYQGESGLEFARLLDAGGASVSVDTTLNVGAVDLMHPHLNRGDPTRIEKGRQLMQLYEGMGCRPTWTCAPYQAAKRPRLGEHLAWAESNAIAFINSVVGARTDRYGDFIDICAAITGRVPNVGLHRTENRRGEEVFDLSGLSREWIEAELFWSLLGLQVGWEVGKRIPVVSAVQRPPSEDQLKAFGAAAASTGSVAMFHVVGSTPEAPTLDEALQGQPALRTRHVTSNMLRESAARLGSSEHGRLCAVSVGTPHFSVSEFAQLVSETRGRRRHPQVEFYVSTSRAVLGEVERREWLGPLVEFGVEVVVDTCTYITPVIRARTRSGVVMTNSAKWAYYAPGNLGFRVALGSLSDCVTSAVMGQVVTESLPGV